MTLVLSSLDLRRRDLLAAVAGGALLVGAPSAAQTFYDATTPQGAPRYQLQVTIDPHERRIEGSGTVTLTPAIEERRQFRFALALSLADSFRIQVDRPAARTITLAPREVYGNLAAWNATLDQPLPAGEPITFRFSFSGAGQGGGDAVFDIAPEGSYGNGAPFPWYPQVLYPVIANPPTLGVVRYRVIGDYTLLSPGIEITTDADRAAGYRAFQTRRTGHFGFAVGHYHVLRGRAGLPVATYLVRERSHIVDAAARLERMMSLYQRWFGPYPQDAISIVEAPSQERFASTNETLLFSSSGSLDDAWEDTFFGHEIAHGWFGGGFTTDLSIGSEGMANYAALRLIEAQFGAAAAKQFRLYGRPGYNSFQCALGYLTIVAAGYDAPLRQRAANYGQEQIGYAKGMLVCDMLSRRMGRERFDRTFRELLRARPYQMQPWGDVERALSRAAREDLSWYFTQWIDRSDAPEVSLEWRESHGRVEGVLRQRGEPFRLTLPLAIRLRSGRTVIREVELQSAETPFSFPVDAPVASVDLDPDYTVLRWTPELRAFADAWAPLTRAIVSGETAPAIATYEHLLATPLPNDTFGVTFMRWCALGRLYNSVGRYSNAVSALRTAWTQAQTREDVAPWTLIRMARSGESAGDKSAELWALERALEVDARNPPSVLGEEARLHRARALAR